MIKLALALFVSLLVLAPTGAGAGAVDDAGAIVDRWAEAYNGGDVEALIALYAPDATLLGMASPTIIEGSGPIRSYVANFLRSGNKIEVGERRLMALSPNAVLSTGFFELITKRNGNSVRILGRFTMLLVKHGNDWLIAHHHSSPRPEPPR